MINVFWVYSGPVRVIHEIKELVKELNPSFSFVPRSQNDFVDHIAKSGVIRQIMYCGPCIPNLG